MMFKIVIFVIHLIINTDTLLKPMKYFAPFMVTYLNDNAHQFMRWLLMIKKNYFLQDPKVDF